MKLLALLVCIFLALMSLSHMSPELATVRALGLARSPAIYFLPVIAALLCFLILTIRSKAGEFAGSRNGSLQLFRILFVGIIWGLVWIAPEWYRRSKVTSVPVNALTIDKIDWQQFQAALDFKVIQVSDVSGTRICFAKAEGREQQLRFTLERFKNE